LLAAKKGKYSSSKRIVKSREGSSKEREVLCEKPEKKKAINRPHHKSTSGKGRRKSEEYIGVRKKEQARILSGVEKKGGGSKKSSIRASSLKEARTGPPGEDEPRKGKKVRENLGSRPRGRRKGKLS